MDQIKVKIALIGGSGAVGREIIRQSQTLNNVHLTIITRSKLEEWTQFKNISIITLDSLKDLETIQDQLTDHQAFICTLGSRIRYPEFVQVDHDFPLLFGKIAKSLNVPYYGLLTSKSSNPNSIFLYLRTKGKVEIALQELDITNLDIFRAGLIKNRENDFRIGELFAKWFVPGVESKDLARVMLHRAIKFDQGAILENNQILEIANSINKLNQ